jgi:hypothetical protein
MKDHEKAKLVNDLRDIALEFHDTQQLRERISQQLGPVFKRLDYLEDRNFQLGWIESPDRMGG